MFNGVNFVAQLLQNYQFKIPLRSFPSGSLTFYFSPQFPILLQQFAAVTCVDFNPIAPHEFAVSSSTRVRSFSLVTRILPPNAPLLKFERFKYLTQAQMSQEKQSHVLRTSHTAPDSEATESCLLQEAKKESSVSLIHPRDQSSEASKVIKSTLVHLIWRSIAFIGRG
jgi:hypothetical protein